MFFFCSVEMALVCESERQSGACVFGCLLKFSRPSGTFDILLFLSMVELRAEHANLHTIPKTLLGKLLKLLAWTPQNVDLNHVRKSWRSPEHDVFYHAETFL